MVTARSRVGSLAMILPNDVLGTVYLVIALLGVLVAVMGWRGSRPGRRRWCPRCGYDLSTTESRTCSECGYSSPRERDFHRRRRRSWAVIVGLLVVATSAGLAVATGAAQSTRRLLGPAWSMIESRALPGGWVVEHQISRDLARTEFNRRIRIQKEGEVHFEWLGASSELGFQDLDRGRTSGLGSDIDRDGEPDLVIGISDGGNASPITWLVLSLASRASGARIEPRAVLHDGRFADVDGDGRVEFLASDTTIRDMWSVYRGIHVPEVVLSPRGHGWQFDPRLTSGRSLPPEFGDDPAAVLAEAGADWRSNGAPFVSRLFGLALALVSRDRGDEALALVQSEWPGDDDLDALPSMTTLVEPGTELPRAYVADPAAREQVLRELVARWRWSDRLPLPAD